MSTFSYASIAEEGKTALGEGFWDDYLKSPHALFVVAERPRGR